MHIETMQQNLLFMQLMQVITYANYLCYLLMQQQLLHKFLYPEVRALERSIGLEHDKPHP